jgi:uncharacterized ferritin-like protein (DUF455 family)
VTVELDPALFAPGSTRDARFDVRQVWAEMTNLSPDENELHPEFLHRQMNEEVDGLEIAARNLTDFPDADWELRLSIARQCWDEARHVDMFRRCLERRGGHVGQYPVLNFQYRITTRISSLVGRLAVQNRSFEAAGIDAIHAGIDEARKAGQDDLAALFDQQLADELQHVRYANTWIAELTRRDGARATFEIVQAVAHANRAMKVVAGEAVVQYPVVDELRKEAGFSEPEIQGARELVNRG